MNDNKNFNESASRVQDCFNAAAHYCRNQGSTSMAFKHLLKAILDNSPFLSSQMKISMKISESQLKKALEDLTLPNEDFFVDEDQIEYSEQVRDYIDTAQNNARMNGRRRIDELDLFYAFFLMEQNPLYQFLDQHNISYKRIFEKSRN